MAHIAVLASNSVAQLEAAVLTKKETACGSLFQSCPRARATCQNITAYLLGIMTHMHDARCVSFLIVSAKTMLHICWAQLRILLCSHCISVGHYDAYAAVFNSCDARCVSFLGVSAKTILHICWAQWRILLCSQAIAWLSWKQRC